MTKKIIHFLFMLFSVFLKNEDASIPRRKINLKQRSTIQHYLRHRYSANRIQKELSKQHMGLRRKTLLGEIRKLKRTPLKPHVEQYTPHKYNVAWQAQTEKARARWIKQMAKSGGSFIQKQIAAYGTQSGKQKRVQMKGSGQQLYQAMKLVSLHPPKKQFLTLDATDLLHDPDEYLERGRWDDRPQIKS